MKVNQNVSIFAGPQENFYSVNGKPGVSGQAGKPGRMTVNGSYLNGQFDPIADKRASAQKRAGKMISDTFAGDKKLDSDQKDRAARIDQYYKVMSDSYKEVSEIDAKKDEIRAYYGVDPDSQEQKDLEILEKYNRKKRGVTGYDTDLSMEELQRAKELEAQGYAEKGYTEYQQRMLETDAGKDIPYADILDAKQQIFNESGTIRAMKLERLKYHEMVDTNKEVEDLMEQTSDEIIGQLVEDAKDNIDEKNEEELEKVQENREEKKEELEKIEEAKERREELEALTDPEHAEKERRRDGESDVAFGDALTEGMLLMQGAKSNIEQEVSDMMLKMKLVTIEAKGIKIDESI
ncbi:MAG: hypothetical protein HFH35_10245 [Eubacterium sp.]|nr:hypothetical protein [Eubacterium sp.]